jgi:hypothetical protein
VFALTRTYAVKALAYAMLEGAAPRTGPGGCIPNLCVNQDITDFSLRELIGNYRSLDLAFKIIKVCIGINPQTSIIF